MTTILILLLVLLLLGGGWTNRAGWGGWEGPNSILGFAAVVVLVWLLITHIR